MSKRDEPQLPWCEECGREYTRASEVLEPVWDLQEKGRCSILCKRCIEALRALPEQPKAQP